MRMKPKREEKPPRLETARTIVVFASLAACVAMAVGSFTGGGLLDFGRGLALLSVGIMQPEGGAQVLSERLDRIPAHGGGGETGDFPASLSYMPGGGMQTSGELNSSKIVPSGDVPPEAGDGGKVIELPFDIGEKFVQGVAVKNASSRTIDVVDQLKKAPDIKIKNTAEPQVLIVHTHTTEAYMTYYSGYFNAADASRSKDASRSVVAVGEAVSAQLRAANIGVIHNVTIHDSPQYTGAYDRSAETVKRTLKQYPSISVVIDLHRDALSKSATEKYKPTVSVQGRKAAQIMIITGVGDTKSTPHPDWQENLRFALRIQSAMHTQYSGIMRPLYLVDSRYNQNLTHGSLLIEVGSEANTVSEAVYSGEILGKTIAQILGTLKK